MRALTAWLEPVAELLPECGLPGSLRRCQARRSEAASPEGRQPGSRMPPGRAVGELRWLSAAVGVAWLWAVMGCGQNAWTDADRAAVAATGAAVEAHALASRVASDAAVEDGTALAEAAREAVEAAWASQAEAREWTERGSGDAVLLAEALRMTDAAWERAAEAAEAALVVWDVALSVAATNVGPGGLAALAAADSAWAWEAATLAALVWDSAGWDSVNVMGYSAETAREFEHLYHPWVDSAAAGQALGEWKALYAAAFAAYEAAEATRDSAAVAVYEAAQDRVLATEKDAADSAADAAWEREWDRVWDEWLGDLSRGTTTTDCGKLCA